MAEHNETGKAGEEQARMYLKKNGYKIHALNWVHNHKEIDIVAEKNETMVFIEVKRNNFV